MQERVPWWCTAHISEPRHRHVMLHVHHFGHMAPAFNQPMVPSSTIIRHQLAPRGIDAWMAPGLTVVPTGGGTATMWRPQAVVGAK